MTSKIYLEQVREIIINRLKGYEIELFLFGSQTRGESSQPSDIDVGVLPKQPLPQNLLSEIREELEESNIPYPVELIDLSKVSHKFARNVREEGIPWHQGKKMVDDRNLTSHTYNEQLAEQIFSQITESKPIDQLTI